MDNRRSSYDGILTKAYDPLEVKADAEKGILSGYASKFWVVDSYAEATAPGSFTKTIAERGPKGANRILLRYEHEHTIGTHTAMQEDGDGLNIEARVSDDGMWGTAVRSHLKDDVQYGLSIGFRRVADRTAEDDDPLDFSSAPDWVKTIPRNEIRILTGVKLMENSVVSFPAVDPALVSSYRSDLDISKLAAELTPEQRAELMQILTAMPADSATTTETAGVVVTQTAFRNYQAEFALLCNQLGVNP
jgi:HK97 family phage prohead protease